MPMVEDISKTLGKDFLIGSFVPASLFVGTNMFYVRWKVLRPDWFRDWTVFESKAVAIVSVTFILGLSLSILRTFIYRSFEGYERRNLLVAGSVLWLLSIMGSFWIHTSELQAAMTCAFWTGAVAVCVGASQHITLRYHRRKHRQLAAQELSPMDRYRFTRRYPEHGEQVLATSFGNVLRAFEEYPSRLYNIDPITIWPRLGAVLPDGYVAQISDSKLIVSFLLNLCIVALYIAIETVLLAPRIDPEKWMGAAVAWAALAAIAYLGSRHAAGVWGEYFRSAFDLYRLDLLKRISVELPAGPISVEQEQEIWHRVQLLTFFAKDSPDLRVVAKESIGHKDTPTTGAFARFVNWLGPTK